MRQLQSNEKAVLCLYAKSQTFTATVFEHLDAFREYSDFNWYYSDIGEVERGNVSIKCFEAVVIHYSVRLPYLQIGKNATKELLDYYGVKILFIQDEYDYTNRSKELILRLGFHLVFTVVPDESIPSIYPSAEFPGVTFVNVLTGYVPEYLDSLPDVYVPPSQRKCMLAYRGRALPIRYGRLGQEKIRLGMMVKNYCEINNIEHDIAWTEEARIYGNAWYEFIASSRAMLGSESGSNVFDWDGDLQAKIDKYKKAKPKASEMDVYDAVVAKHDIDGMMNQISPRIFEMIACRTAMVLFEGNYSGLLTPNEHYIPLRKDFSNIDDVVSKLKDVRLIDQMVINAFEDIIATKKHSYNNFLAKVDRHIRNEMRRRNAMYPTKNLDIYRQSLKGADVAPFRSSYPRPQNQMSDLNTMREVYSAPQRSAPPFPQSLAKFNESYMAVWKSKAMLVQAKLILIIWKRVPIMLRPIIKTIFRRPT